MKHTQVKWQPRYVNTICIGVGTEGDYSQMICNTILPDTDEQYELEKDEIEANAKLIASAPDLLEALIHANKRLEDLKAKYPDANKGLEIDDIMISNLIAIKEATS